MKSINIRIVNQYINSTAESKLNPEQRPIIPPKAPEKNFINISDYFYKQIGRIFCSEIWKSCVEPRFVMSKLGN